MPAIQCFMLEKRGPWHRAWHLSEPKWGSAEKGNCPNDPDGQHRAKYTLESEEEIKFDWNDPAAVWPTHCSCGYEFTDKAGRSGSGCDQDWYRVDTGERIDGPMPVGAMWYADWKIYDGMPAFGQEPETPHAMVWWRGPDERSLCVQTPGGEWNIDSRASNCTMPEDNTHRCWVRHGVPPNVTVGKDGHTCQAGGGSIQCGNYHGFLRNGMLVDA